MPSAARTSATALLTSASMSRPGAGRTWTVTSRPTSDCQVPAVLTTNIATPVVSEARNVIMATTAASERTAIELFGTIDFVPRGTRASAGAASRSSQGSCIAAGSVVDMQTSIVQHQTARIEFIHQGNIVCRDHDRRARFVELDE